MSSAPQVTAQVGRGVASMLARFVVVTPLSFLASIALARLLTPAEFGAYATVSVLVIGVGGLLELGLMSVLIQQPEEPTPHEMRVVFTAYLAVFGALAALTVVAAPWIAPFFKLPADGAAMLRWMSLQMVLGVIGCIPTMRIERHMRFGAVASIDVAVAVLDKAGAVALAVYGFGAWSFVWASLASVSLRMALLTWVAPWPFGLAFDPALLRAHLAKGALFQGVNVATLIRDNVVAFVAGPIFGPRAVGLLNWGAGLPTMFAGQGLWIYFRVVFPAFARLQDDREARSALLVASLRALMLGVLPILALLPALGGPIVDHVYGAQWREALPALACFAVRTAGYAVVAPMIWYLNATGRVATGLRALLICIVLEWGLALALAPALGFTGVAIGAAAGTLFQAAALWLAARREEPLAFGAVVGPGLAIAAPLGLAAWAIAPHVRSVVDLLGVLAGAGVLWAGAAYVAERERVDAAWLAWRARRGVS